MTPHDLRIQVRGLADEHVAIVPTNSGCIATRDGRAIRFWLQDPDGQSFHYTRTIDGEPGGLGVLQSKDVNDVLRYLRPCAATCRCNRPSLGDGERPPAPQSRTGSLSFN